MVIRRCRTELSWWSAAGGAQREVTGTVCSAESSAWWCRPVAHVARRTGDAAGACRADEATSRRSWNADRRAGPTTRPTPTTRRRRPSPLRLPPWTTSNVVDRRRRTRQRRWWWRETTLWRQLQQQPASEEQRRYRANLLRDQPLRHLHATDVTQHARLHVTDIPPTILANNAPLQTLPSDYQLSLLFFRDQ